MRDNKRHPRPCDVQRTDSVIRRTFRLLFRTAVALLAAIGLVAVVIVIANAREPYGGPLEG